MVIDLDRCVGCQSCVVACKVENNTAISSEVEAAAERDIEWIPMVSTFEGEFPEVRTRFMPVPCVHCENSPCVAVCPTGATYDSKETGIVAQIYPRCIGCRYCCVACPYTCKYFNWYAPTWPKEMQSGLNPDVSVRPKGVAEKCTFCSHRVARVRENAAAENREIRDGDYQTACQEACPAKAISFGDLDDPNSRVAGLVKSPRAFRIQEELGTEPKVYYLREGEWYVPHEG
jgi:molybdopterin-containing oxidoreductase family iron-sulfur binding subunit